MRISDWSSDVCSSDLAQPSRRRPRAGRARPHRPPAPHQKDPDMSQNKLRQHFAAGGDAIGGWCTTPSAFNAEMLAVAGFDYVCVDCQHGLIGYDAMVPMLASISRTGATPVVDRKSTRLNSSH